MRVRDRAGQAPDDLVVSRLQALAPHLDGEPDPAWQGATRARLVAMAAVRGPEPAPVSPLRRFLAEDVSAPARWRRGLTAGLAGAALSVTALATLVTVASEARPGDLLYGLKRGTEQTQLALAGDARGELLLDLASTRLDEVRALVDSGATALPAAGSSGSGETVLAAGSEAVLLVETLGTMDAHTAEGARWLTERAVGTEDAGPLELLEDWLAVQSEGLADLRDDVPAAAEDEVLDSLGLLTDIATRVSGLDLSLNCADGPAVRGTDELGPVPVLCLAGAPTSSGSGAAGSGEGSSASPGAPDPGSGTTPITPGPSLPPVGGEVPHVPGVTGGGVPGSTVPPLPTGIVPTTPPPVLLPLPTPLPTLPGLVPPSPSASSALPGTLPTLPGTTHTDPLATLPGTTDTDPLATLPGTTDTDPLATLPGTTDTDPLATLPGTADTDPLPTLPGTADTDPLPTATTSPTADLCLPPIAIGNC